MISFSHEDDDSDGNTTYRDGQASAAKRKNRKKMARQQAWFGIFSEDQIGSSDDDLGASSGKRYKDKMVKFISVGVAGENSEGKQRRFEDRYMDRKKLDGADGSDDNEDDDANSIVVDLGSGDEIQREECVEIDSDEEEREGARGVYGEEKNRKRWDSHKNGVRKSPGVVSVSSSSDEEKSKKKKKSRFRFENAKQEDNTDKKRDVKELQNEWTMDRMSKEYGVGFNIMQKMGYSGGGLGRGKAGLQNPLTVRLRAKNRGLQDYGERIHSNEKETKLMNDQSAVEMLLNSKKKTQKDKPKAEDWRISSTQGKAKRTYRTVEEVHGEVEGDTTGRNVGMRIIDMTGPQPRVLDSASDLQSTVMMVENELENNKPLNAITVSLKNALKSAKTELRMIARDRQFEANSFMSLSNINSKVKEKVDLLDKQIYCGKQILAVLTAMHKRLSSVKYENEANETKATAHLDTALSRYTTAKSTTAAIIDLRDECEEDTFVLGGGTNAPAGNYSENLVSATSGKIGNRNGIWPSLSEMHDHFEKLKFSFTKEFEFFNIGRISVVFFKSVLPQIFNGWLPLNTPNFHAADVKLWSTFLELHCSDSSNETSEAVGLHKGSINPSPWHTLPVLSPAKTAFESFQQCVEKEVGNRIREALVNKWNVFNVEPAIQLCEIWQPVLPSTSFKVTIQNVVAPKLLTAIELYDIRSNLQPLPSWIFPWLPYLGEALPMLLERVRLKFSMYLQHWTPSERMALSLLLPWKPIFYGMTWDLLMHRYIIPRLSESLLNTAIRPDAQSLEPIQTVFEWVEAIGTPDAARLLDHSFFPEWIRVLHTWISSPTAEYDQIIVWYQGWKSTFPRQLLKEEVVRIRFAQALQIISQVTSGDTNFNIEDTLPGRPQKTSASHATHSFADEKMRDQIDGAAAPPPLPREPPPPTPEELRETMSLKDYLEVLAGSNDLVMRPKIGRIENGKQVYAFGRASIYIEQNVVFLLQHGSWIPIRVDEILQFGKGLKAGHVPR